MPAVSHTNMEVGTVFSAGCSKTMCGLRRSPRMSQIAFPKRDTRPPIAVRVGVLPVRHHAPVIEFLRLMHPFAPSFTQNSILRSSLMTATGMPPCALPI